MSLIEIIEKIKGLSAKKSIVVVVVVVVVVFLIFIGVFMRVYHFEQWLQFAPDQARDMMVIENAANGKDVLPSLGPQAGNTRFSLGPLYYQVQFLSAKIFGVNPVSMALPDLFFGILTLPLLFLFFRKYFTTNLSLVMLGIISISFVDILSSRSALNPNSIPFFVLLFLFGLLEIMKKQSTGKMLFWYAIVGFSMGVGVQLHAILIFSMPTVAGLVFLWLLKGRQVFWKGFLLLLLTFLLVNVGQIRHEIAHDGSNSRALLKGVMQRGDSKNKLSSNVVSIVACQTQANIFFLTSFENRRKCGDFLMLKGISSNNEISMILTENAQKIVEIFLGVIFLIGGCVCWFVFFKEEKDVEKKRFLVLIAVYALITFLVLIPVAQETETRYFNVLIMVPFLMLGLWLKMISRQKMFGAHLAMFLVILIFCLNLYVDFRAGVSYFSKSVSDSENSILGEIRPMAEYISSNKPSSGGVVLLFGGERYEKRFFKPLDYLLHKKNISLQRATPERMKKNNDNAFYISKDMGEAYPLGENFAGRRIVKIKKFQNVYIYTLAN